MGGISHDNLGRERELERRQRRLERECQLGDESEQVESWQPGRLEILFVQKPCKRVFVFLCQPPSIRPISSRCLDKAIYFLLSIFSISHII